MDITIEDFEFGRTDRTDLLSRSFSEAHDDRLASAAAAGDDEAFCKLVELHQERVFHFCFRWLRNSEDAREAAQDTFIRVYEAIPRYEKRGKFTTWLYRIALNLCRDHFKSKAARQRRATQSFGDVQEPSICPLARPDETAAKTDEHARMQEEIMALPDKLRAAVVLFALEGLSQSDCAAILKCSVRAVEGRLYRAREILRVAAESES
ncbi:MAG: sigma-70 family RNA polymerase sigma factor [Verrucomicrobiales bacterium]|nr:sigma-70 family RNA polymerase sigma factor [Verrucomicrobiales bacterium]